MVELYQVNGSWARKCPVCNREVIFTGKWARSNAYRACKRKLPCNSCAMKGKSHPCPEHQKNILREKMKGSNNGMFGKATWMKGRKHSDEAREKMRRTSTGVIPSSDTKRKLRVAAIEQHQKNGIDFPAVDAGANEWFDDMKSLGYNFIINYHLKELGYFADGYDKNQHIWMEYDTPSHNSTKVKDLNRQKEIIQYFESIGNPLKQFVRVDASKPDRIAIEIVYRNT